MPSDSNKTPGPQRGGPDGGKPPVRFTRSSFGLIVILGIALVLMAMFSRSLSGTKEVSIDQFWTLVKNGAVERIELRDNDSFTAQLYKDAQGPNPEKILVRYPAVGPEFDKFQAKLDDARKAMSKQREITLLDNRSTSFLWQALLSSLPWIILIVLAWWFLFRQLRQSGAGAGMLGNFGRSRHRLSTKEHTHITFSDVAGIDEAKDEVLEIVEFLKNPKRFQKLGGRIPRGVLLVGEPGCGKTLLAKAIAGEADVPFFSISGSDFVEMFVGVGASRVRDLFRQAKENSPCIVFLDEIDAVGRRRGLGYNGGGHDEREQTLNAILVEMDGFDSNDQVIVIAATNRSDVLDPALVRPGRFDRQVFVPLPDVKGRYEILKVHAKKIKLQPPLENKLQRLARATPLFSGADLAAIINEAALLATLASKDWVELEDLEEARDKIRFGRAKRSRVIDEKERILTAHHEAGHAVVQSLLKYADPVHKVSIIPRGPYGGVTFSLPEKDRMTVARSYLHDQLRVLCAGRIAEELCGEDVNSGAAGDIRQATSIARQMVTDWGMSANLGFVHYGEADRERMFEMFGQREHSEHTSEQIDAEVKKLIDSAYEDARRLIAENRDKVHAVAQALLKYETLDGEDVRAILAGQTIDKPTVADLIAAEQDRRLAAEPPLARPVERPSDGGAGPLPSPA